MTIHQCPKCELKFALHTVLDDHLRNDHPEFHHEYPVRGVRHFGDETAPPAPPAPPAEPSVANRPQP
jgi:hypothetical protein